MNPTFLPPQPNLYNPPSNGYPPVQPSPLNNNYNHSMGPPPPMNMLQKNLPPQQQFNNAAPPQQFNSPPPQSSSSMGQPPFRPGGPQSQYLPPPPPPGATNSGIPPQVMRGQMPPLPHQQQQQQQLPPRGADMLTNKMQGMSLNPHMMPPYNNMQGSTPGGGAPNFQPPIQQQHQPPPQTRLDPDQMPSPIQVIDSDQRTRNGVFLTNQKGLVPPLVTTEFVVQDGGNTSPRFIRSTMYNIPTTNDIMKQTGIPFSLVLSPMARLKENEFPPPIVNFGDLGPVRCIRCKAYMCPFMQFIDSGRRFQCLFCKATTDVPTEYFQHLDHTGQRMDKFERPELILGTYEFIATADYCRQNILPKAPAFIFIIDVSYNNIKSGLVALICSQMKDILKNLPKDQNQEKSNMKVGFITYNSSVHFYNIKSTLAAPQMMTVSDTQEMFMPLLDGFLSTPEESEEIIDTLMEQIPKMFQDTKETEILLLPAISAGLEALKASETVGKLFVFHSTLPTAECPGKLKNRDDRKLLGTEKEKVVLIPQNQHYNQLAQECVGSGCSIDLFIFNNSYIDLATIGQLSRLTGGEIFKYTYFQADIDGERLINDIILDINRPIAFDGVMRVRTSQGIRPTDFFGHFFMANTTDIELAAIDCDKGIAIEIKHDDKLSEEDDVYIQAALLYTSCSGVRRLRIMNLSLKTCSQMAELYRCCDLDTIINFLAKQAVYKLFDNNPKSVKEHLVNRGAQTLATYRKHCASPSSSGQLILPECMKLLPLYLNCLLRSDALAGGSEITLDDRSFHMQIVLTMDVVSSMHYFYPSLIALHEIGDSLKLPLPIRCTFEKLHDNGIYLLDNGVHMFLYVTLGAASDLIQNLFGVSAVGQIEEFSHLPDLDNPLSIAVRNLITEIRLARHRFMRLTVVKQKDKLESIFRHFLVEDRGIDGSASYVDFLCHLHKEIRALLT